jgi:uncharacterized membrane protein
MFSQFLTLDYKDFAKGFFMAVLGAVLGLVYSAVQNGTLSTINWGTVVQCAATAGIGYLIKNYFSDESGKVFGMIG